MGKDGDFGLGPVTFEMPCVWIISRGLVARAIESDSIHRVWIQSERDTDESSLSITKVDGAGLKDREPGKNVITENKR